MSFRGAVDVPESYRIDEFRDAWRRHQSRSPEPAGLPLASRFLTGRVERWRGGTGEAYLFPTLSVVGASIASPYSVSTSRSSNRACGFLAHGSPTGFSRQHTMALLRIGRDSENIAIFAGK